VFVFVIWTLPNLKNKCIDIAYASVCSSVHTVKLSFHGYCDCSAASGRSPEPGYSSCVDTTQGSHDTKVTELLYYKRLPQDGTFIFLVFVLIIEDYIFMHLTSLVV
jgi:hypothetical protein